EMSLIKGEPYELTKSGHIGTPVSRAQPSASKGSTATLAVNTIKLPYNLPPHITLDTEYSALFSAMLKSRTKEERRKRKAEADILELCTTNEGEVPEGLSGRKKKKMLREREFMKRQQNKTHLRLCAYLRRCFAAIAAAATNNPSLFTQAEMRFREEDTIKGWTPLDLAGTCKTGCLALPGLRIKFNYRPGDIILVRGRLIKHGVVDWEGDGNHIFTTSFNHYTEWELGEVQPVCLVNKVWDPSIQAPSASCPLLNQQNWKYTLKIAPLPQKRHDSMRKFTAYVTWPSDHIIGLVETALHDISGPEILSKTAPGEDTDPGLLLQWTTYDSLVHSLTLEYPDRVLTSSYNIRKALIRKHFLYQTVTGYLTKRPGSILRKAVPQTWLIDISFADELDDAWADELWDLSEELERGDKWFILKPGMADRGQGIRMFNSRESLQNIFESFEDNSSDEETTGSDVDAQGNSKTAVMTSQLRHFVIQEYLDNPLLVDPAQAKVDLSAPTPSQGLLRGRKFHLRVYCVASGALKLFMSPNILALFAGTVYAPPSSLLGDDPSEIDLSPHLTNTALQDNVHESSIRLLKELIGCDILSAPTPSSGTTFRLEDAQDIEEQVSSILAETFKAALTSVVHFQVLPNAFELFGVDFLVTHTPELEPQSSRFQVHLLEVNAEPAIELTGVRLNWILVDLFKGIAHTCVKPFFEGAKPNSNQDQESNQWLRKCLDIETRKY
ncbi:unnamed protein product, partial [Rhizoctonia solani]